MSEQLQLDGVQFAVDSAAWCDGCIVGLHCSSAAGMNECVRFVQTAVCAALQLSRRPWGLKVTLLFSSVVKVKKQPRCMPHTASL
jgi:hypothetical protein